MKTFKKDVIKVNIMKLFTILFMLVLFSVSSLAVCDNIIGQYASCDEVVRLESNCTTASVYDSNYTNTQNITLNYLEGEYYFSYNVQFINKGWYLIDFCDNTTYTTVNVDDAGTNLQTQATEQIGVNLFMIGVIIFICVLLFMGEYFKNFMFRLMSALSIIFLGLYYWDSINGLYLALLLIFSGLLMLRAYVIKDY